MYVYVYTTFRRPKPAPLRRSRSRRMLVLHRQQLFAYMHMTSPSVHASVHAHIGSIGRPFMHLSVHTSDHLPSCCALCITHTHTEAGRGGKDRGGRGGRVGRGAATPGERSGSSTAAAPDRSSGSTAATPGVSPPFRCRPSFETDAPELVPPLELSPPPRKRSQPFAACVVRCMHTCGILVDICTMCVSHCHRRRALI